MEGRGGPMRIGLDAHVLGRRQAGNETYTLGLAKALDRAPEVDLVLYLDGGAEFGSTNGTRIRHLAFRRAQPRIALELPRRARLDRLDVLHMQYVVPPLPGVPVVTTIHDLSFLDVPHLLPPARALRLRVTVADAVRRSAVVLTPSSFSRDRLLHHYPVPPERVIAAPPLLAPLPAADDAAPEDVAAVRLALHLERPFVLAVGELQPRKNVARLVEAMALARRDGLDTDLVLVGRRGWRADEVDRAIAVHGAASWVRLLGYAPARTVQALYRAARLVAFVSLYEGFGLPVLEAMAAGTPVLASKAGSIPEVAADGALLVDPLDTRAMAEALASLATDEALRTTLAAAASRRVAHYRSGSGLDAVINAYRQAIAR
ncbi:MAG: glycosyltransferase family 1 protein [Chloroflexota bacterium]